MSHCSFYIHSKLEWARGLQSQLYSCYWYSYVKNWKIKNQLVIYHPIFMVSLMVMHSIANIMSNTNKK